MASLGAKVMQPVSIQDARLNRIDIEVKSSFIKKSGTLITKRNNIINNKIVTGISSTQNDSKVSLIGVGMITTPGVTFKMFQTLANKKINIQVISTSEIKISVLINKKNTKKALEALHKEFKLDKQK